jgi:hypothetical protein
MGDKYISCSGYVTVIHGDIVDSNYKIFYDGTNNFGEIYAIYMGIQSLVSLKDYDLFLNLFSDSKISVFGVRDWIFNWVKNMDSNYVLKTASNISVANQDVFVNVVNNILQANSHISIYHQKGHRNPDNVNNMENCISLFSKMNGGEQINIDIAREISYYNNLVDKTSRDILLNTTNSRYFDPNKYIKYPELVGRILTQQDMVMYNELINHFSRGGK